MLMLIREDARERIEYHFNLGGWNRYAIVIDRQGHKLGIAL